MAQRIKIYTKQGDGGFTSLLGCKEVSKANLKIIALGAIDELNSIIGIILSFNPSKEVKNYIKPVQNDLFIIQAELAGVNKKIDESKTKRLEKIIDKIFSKVLIKGFVIPGGRKTGALLDWARTVCRRAEIEVVKLSKKTKINPEILKYLNRLSDFLYILARWENRNIEEKAPKY